MLAAPSIDARGREITVVAKQGLPLVIEFQILESIAVPRSISGWTFQGTVRRSRLSSGAASAVFSFSITDAAEGRGHAYLTASQTNALSCGERVSDADSQYVFELRATSDEGAVYSIRQGPLFVDASAID